MGFRVVRWMIEHGIWPTDDVFVHSENVVRGPEMRADVARYFHPRKENHPEARSIERLPGPSAITDRVPGLGATRFEPPGSMPRQRRRAVRDERLVDHALGLLRELRAHRFEELGVLVEVDHGRGHGLGRVDEPLVPDGHPGAGDRRPGVPGGVGRRRRGAQPDDGDDPADVADVGRAAVGVRLGRPPRLNRRVEALGLDARGPLDVLGELLLFGREGDRPEPHHVVVHGRGPGQVDQRLPIARLDGDLPAGLGHQGRPLGDLAGPFEQLFDPGPLRIP